MLDTLGAASNRLHGTLPQTWSFRNLTLMILDSNSLSGWPAHCCAGDLCFAGCLNALPLEQRLDVLKRSH